MAGGSFSRKLLIGNLVIFLACAGSAFYNVYGKRLLEKFPESEVLLYGYIVAIVACVPLASLNHEGLLWRVTQYPASVWVSIAVLGGLSWGLAMVLWMWVLKRIQASQASVSIYLLPVLGVALSAITLHEKLNRFQIIGGLLVVLCTFASTEYEARITRKNAPAVSV
jgi:drug/metabolite transporter (DMT)-like permease